MRSRWSRGPEPGFATADLLAAGLLALAATVVLAAFYAGTMALRHQDTLFLVEGLQSILATGTPWTPTVSTSADAFKFFEAAPDVVCANPLRASGTPFNLLRLHGYLALYPMAALAAGIGVVAALALLNAAAHVALLLLPYVFLRRRGVPALASVPLEPAAYDIVVIATAHTAIDYARLVDDAQLVVDLRNATGRAGITSDKVWKL